MKKLLVLAFALVVFVSCKNEPQRYFSESAEIDAIKASIEAYESQDWDTWKSHFADDAYVFVNSKDSINVADRLVQLKETAAMTSDYGFERDDEWIEMVLDKDDETWVYYWAQWNGTLSATDDVVSVPVHLSIKFENGKIVKEHVYFDGTEMSEKMNAIAAAEAAAATEMDSTD